MPFDLLAIHFGDVESFSGADAVAPVSDISDYREPSVTLIFRKLFWREPFLQEGDCFIVGLGFSFRIVSRYDAIFNCGCCGSTAHAHIDAIHRRRQVSFNLIAKDD